MNTVKVVKSDPPESKEVLAAAITRISDSLNYMMKSGINMRAIIILLQAETRLPKKDIELVLESLKRLKGWYCN